MKSSILIGSMLACASSVSAQDVAPCGGDHAAWLADNAGVMTGNWTDTPAQGLIAGQPMPLGSPEPVQITVVPDGFSALGEEPVRTYTLLLIDGPFSIDPPGGAAELRRIDNVELPACAIADLPRLEARYTLDIDGGQARGTIAAVIASTQRMHIWFALDTPFGRVEQLSTLTR